MAPQFRIFWGPLITIGFPITFLNFKFYLKSTPISNPITFPKKCPKKTLASQAVFQSPSDKIISTLIQSLLLVIGLQITFWVVGQYSDFLITGQSSSNGGAFNRMRLNNRTTPTKGPAPTSTSSSLPASAVSAAPYIPPSYQQQDPFMHHHHHHIAYYESPPPPMGQPPPPWISGTPYFFDQSGAGPPGGAAPPFVQHMCSMPPPPHLVPTSIKNGGGRATPSPSSSVAVSSSNSVVNSSEVQLQQYEVEYHLVRQGEVVSLQLGDGRVEIIPGKDFIFKCL